MAVDQLSAKGTLSHRFILITRKAAGQTGAASLPNHNSLNCVRSSCRVVQLLSLHGLEISCRLVDALISSAKYPLDSSVLPLERVVDQLKSQIGNHTEKEFSKLTDLRSAVIHESEGYIFIQSIFGVQRNDCVGFMRVPGGYPF